MFKKYLILYGYVFSPFFLSSFPNKKVEKKRKKKGFPQRRVDVVGMIKYTVYIFLSSLRICCQQGKQYSNGFMQNIPIYLVRFLLYSYS